ncbi:MAG: bifunctional glutamate N-acetyltransferase/amino-acid acetyltransferase ArgJ, partial [Bacteroidota bacterium]
GGGGPARGGCGAGGRAGGLKKHGRPDLALLASETPAASAGVFTTNLVKGHSLLLTQARIGRPVRAVVINSGNANACMGRQGEEAARSMADAAAEALGLRPLEVLTASTGVIGQPLDLSAVSRGVARAAAALSPEGGADAARAIMTTDTFPKEAAVALNLGGRRIVVGGMAKGSGMIHPNLATLLGFLTTDAPVGPAGLDAALREAAEVSFNAITVDGDTSPCDSVLALANGRAGGEELVPGTEDFRLFSAALREVALDLARMVARDGEGATKFLAITVRGARTGAEARLIGRRIAASCLVKTAFFGADANWGRVITAAGNAGVPLDPARIKIDFGGITVCRDGAWTPFSEERVLEVLRAPEIEVAVDLGLGAAEATIWTTDLGFDYVRINASYRS